MGVAGAAVAGRCDGPTGVVPTQADRRGAASGAYRCALALLARGIWALIGGVLAVSALAARGCVGHAAHQALDQTRPEPMPRGGSSGTCRWAPRSVGPISMRPVPAVTARPRRVTRWGGDRTGRPWPGPFPRRPDQQDSPGLRTWAAFAFPGRHGWSGRRLPAVRAGAGGDQGAPSGPWPIPAAARTGCGPTRDTVRGPTACTCASAGSGPRSRSVATRSPGASVAAVPAVGRRCSMGCSRGCGAGPPRHIHRVRLPLDQGGYVIPVLGL
ncbi:hypothetical protein ABH926_009189 [Catenulispora sp. GP43]